MAVDLLQTGNPQRTAPIDLFNRPPELVEPSPWGVDAIKAMGRTIQDAPTIAGALAKGAFAFPISGLTGLAGGFEYQHPSELLEEGQVGPMAYDYPNKKINSVADRISAGEHILLPDGKKVYGRQVWNGEKALELMEGVQATVTDHFYRPEQYKAFETLMKPFEWVEHAGGFYGDWAEKQWGPVAGATVKTAFESLVYLGMPMAKSKLIGSIRKGKANAARDALRAIRKENLEKLKAEPKHLAALVAAEEALAASRKTIGAPLRTPNKEFAKSARVPTPGELGIKRVPRPESPLPKGAPATSLPKSTGVTPEEFLSRRRTPRENPMEDLLAENAQTKPKKTYAEQQAEATELWRENKRAVAEQRLEDLKQEPTRLDGLTKAEQQIQKAGEGKVGPPLRTPNNTPTRSVRPPTPKELGITIKNRPESPLPKGKPATSLPKSTGVTPAQFLENKAPKDLLSQKRTQEAPTIAKPPRTKPKAWTFREKHERFKVLEGLRTEGSLAEPVGVIYNNRHLFSPQEMKSLFEFAESGKKAKTVFEVADSTGIGDLVGYDKIEYTPSSRGSIPELLVRAKGESGFLDLNFLSRKGKGTKHLVQEMEKSMRIVPDYRGGWKPPIRQRPTSIGEVSRPKRDISPGATIQSPHNVFHGLFEDNKTNPVFDAMEGLMAFTRNLEQTERWGKHVLKDIPDASKHIDKRMKIVFNTHKDRLEGYSVLKENESYLKERLEKSEGTPAASELAKQLKMVTTELEASVSRLDQFYKDHAKATIELAQKHPDVRVALLSEDKLPKGIKVTQVERDAANAIKSYMAQTGKELKSLGIPSISNKPYVTHLWKEFISDPGAASFMQSMHKKSKVPSVLRFQHRMPGSRQWFPSANKVLQTHIPIVERKVAYQPFLNKWSQFARTINQPELGKYMDKWINKNLFRGAETVFEKGLNAAVTFEYIRLVGGSLSVAAKHLSKLLNTQAQHGVGTNLKAAYAMAKVPVQLAKKKAGVKGEFAEAKLYRAFVNAQHMVRAMDETPSFRKTTSEMIKKVSGQPMLAIEALDNGISVMSGAIAAENRGLPASTAQAAIWQTVLDANFRAGWDQPLWQKPAAARAVTMFQSTPFKLGEYKYQLVKRALNNERDVFGTHYGTMATRYLIMVGLVEAAARANDTSILEWFLHPPFVQHIIKPTAEPPYYEPHEPELSQSPLLQAVSQMHSDGVGGGLKEHFNYMGTPSKIHRVMNANYPTDWYDSPWKQMLGLPKIDAGKGSKGSRSRGTSRANRTRK